MEDEERTVRIKGGKGKEAVDEGRKGDGWGK